jgi:hypothetical protein
MSIQNKQTGVIGQYHPVRSVMDRSLQADFKCCRAEKIKGNLGFFQGVKGSDSPYQRSAMDEIMKQKFRPTGRD